MLTITIFFPVMAIHMAFKASQQVRLSEIEQQVNERLETEIQLLDRTYDDVSWIFLNIQKLYEQTLEEGQDTLLQSKLSDFARKAPFPIELECIFTDASNPDIRQHHFIGPNLGLSSCGKPTASRNAASARRISEYSLTPEQQAIFSYIYENVLHIKRGLTLREKKSSLMLAGKILSDNLTVFFLADLKNISLQKSIAGRIRIHDNQNVGVGALVSDTPTPVFSDYFKKFPELQTYIRSKLSQPNQKPAQYSALGHKIHIASFDARKKCRFFAVTASNSEQTRKNQFPGVILSAMGIFSCLLFKLIMEKLTLGRGPDFSIKIMLPLTFLFMIILPVFAGTSFIGDFYHSSYANEKFRVSERLAGDIAETDLRSNDLVREAINGLRSFDSIELISSYTGKVYSGNDAEITCDVLNRLDAEGWNELTLCLAPHGKSLTKTSWVGKRHNYEEDKSKNPVVQLFELRAQELLNTKLGNDKNSSERSAVSKNQDFKTEVARDFFLKGVGAESYYRFRQNNEVLFSLMTRFRNYYFLFKTITWNKLPYAYTVWEFRKGVYVDYFPKNRLSLATDSPRLAFSGAETQIRAKKYNIDSLRQKFPELVRIAELAHISRARVISRSETASSTFISEAVPGNFTADILAGSESLQSYAVFAGNLAWQMAKILVLLILPGVFMAYFGALYFTAPLNDLTMATNQISQGNFAYRISCQHPDEFSDIGRAFNTMANGLDEGQRLKSYVSGSVMREVAEFANGNIGERAEARHATIIFSAINGFREFQASHSAAEVFALLQTHLQAADRATQTFGGEIDKMIEDKVMIVFEHHEEEPAIAQAVELASAIADRMAAETGHKVSIGINSGLTISGIMGAESARLSRTVVGDPVNLAARLAYVASQQQHGGIVISGHLKQWLPQGFIAETLPIKRVKGKTQEVEACLLQKTAVSS